MIDETLLASLGTADNEAEAMLTAAFGKKASTTDEQYMDSFLGEQIADLSPGKLIRGKVVGFACDPVLVGAVLSS